MNCEEMPPRPAGERLELGLAIFTPIASASGCPSLFVFQPLFRGAVLSSVGVVIGAQLFLFIANCLFGLEKIAAMDMSGQTLEMPLGDLYEFLRTIAQSGTPTQLSTSQAVPDMAGSQLRSSMAGQPVSQPATAGINNTAATGGGFLTPQVREAPVIIGLAAAADYSNLPFSPGVFLLVPVLTLPGVRGALPMLILETILTIFVRAVAAPQSTGVRPITKPTPGNSRPVQFAPDDLVKFLNRFGKHFRRT